ERIARCRELRHAPGWIGTEQRSAARSPRSTQAGGCAQPDEVPRAADPVTYAAGGDRASSERDDGTGTVRRRPERRRLARPEPGLPLRGKDLRHRAAGTAFDLLVEIEARDPQLRREQRRHRALPAPRQPAEEYVPREESRPLPRPAQRRLQLVERVATQ